ncbi:hypothetical protein CKAH01_09554 [Colletotrichum kahawae]|uniref:Uncharacterized protein n=1 Tax=Colletotrichum kahawae TaxID=34407 RepID=A0AAE0CY39_COLKA|nr:hypothetical protein CKAH01_09554 [Colletotrichum kahawae]
MMPCLQQQDDLPSNVHRQRNIAPLLSDSTNRSSNGNLGPQQGRHPRMSAGLAFLVRASPSAASHTLFPNKTHQRRSIQRDPPSSRSTHQALSKTA